MGLISLIWAPGKRTITLSVFACILGVLIQADSQGILHLAPMIKLVFNMGLALVLPMIPVFLRKGINDALNEGANK